MMDHKTSGEMFQEIIVELSEMKPTALDDIEKDDKKLQGEYFDNIPRLPEAGNNGTS